MDDVSLVRASDGTFEWHCEKCASLNRIFASHLGTVVCYVCRRTSFIHQVIR